VLWFIECGVFFKTFNFYFVCRSGKCMSVVFILSSFIDGSNSQCGSVYVIFFLHVFSITRLTADAEGKFRVSVRNVHVQRIEL